MEFKIINSKKALQEVVIEPLGEKYHLPKDGSLKISIPAQKGAIELDINESGITYWIDTTDFSVELDNGAFEITAEMIENSKLDRA